MNLSPVAPETVGIPSSALQKLLCELDKLDTMNSIMILRHGKLCLHASWSPYQADQPHMLFSLSKSFTSCAIGLAQSEGLLNINDKLISFFPEYDRDIIDERMRSVTLRDLLTMRSGHQSCTVGKLQQSPDGNWVRTYLGTTLDYEPGTHFTYNSGATYMLAAIIRKLTGLNVREYLMPRIFSPLDILPGFWECCPQGTNFGGWGLYLKTEDIAKFAQLLLQEGKWEGKQLLPADYLKEASSSQADNSMNGNPDWKLGYGYQFWMSRHGFRGDGASGQFALVLPKEDMVIAITACLENTQVQLELCWNLLLPQLSDSPLTDAPEDRKALEEFAKKLTVRTAKGDLTRRGPSKLFHFLPNPAKIIACAVDFDSTGCTLTFGKENGITEQLRAGFGSFRTGVIQWNDVLPHPYAASAAWIDDHTLSLQSFITDGTFRDEWTVDFEDTHSPLKRRSRCSTFRPGMAPLELA